MISMVRFLSAIGSGPTASIPLLFLHQTFETCSPGTLLFIVDHKYGGTEKAVRMVTGSRYWELLEEKEIDLKFKSGQRTVLNSVWKNWKVHSSYKVALIGTDA